MVTWQLWLKMESEVMSSLQVPQQLGGFSRAAGYVGIHRPNFRVLGILLNPHRQQAFSWHCARPVAASCIGVSCSGQSDLTVIMLPVNSDVD